MKYTRLSIDPGRDTALPIGVNLTSNPVRDCGLTMRPFHPPSPQPPPAPPQGGSIRGGQEILLRPP